MNYEYHETMHGNVRIYVLGVGNIGKFVAHALKKQHPWLHISLLLHRHSLVYEWEAAGRTIECVTNGCSDKQAGFDVEVISSSASEIHSQVLENPIEHLIVATKTTVTAYALGLVKHRLRSSSTILFLQNGIGTLDEVSASVFDDVKSRPSYLVGICCCSIHCMSAFSVVHAGRGAIEIGRVSRESYELHSSASSSPEPPDSITQLFLSAPDIEATLVTPDQIKEAQLRKLTVNAVINPLTAVFRCKRGQLMDRPQRFALMKVLFEEVAEIVLEILPQAFQCPRKRVSEKEKLWLMVLKIAESPRESTSSMLQDIEAGRDTEIDYINGYLVSQGQRLGFTCTNNNAIIDMVKKRRVVRDEEIEFAFRMPV